MDYCRHLTINSPRLTKRSREEKEENDRPSKKCRVSDSKVTSSKEEIEGEGSGSGALVDRKRG